MNYIHKLQKEIKDKEAMLQKMVEALQGLRAYLQSEKFRCGNDLDGYVNTQDVLNRLPR